MELSLPSISTLPLNATFGVQVEGVDLTQPIPPPLRKKLRSLFFEHHLLLFRGQDFDVERQIEFMEIINKVICEPELTLLDSARIAANQRYSFLSNTDKATQGPADNELCFHADMSWTPQGPMQAICLYATEMEQASQTHFANMVNAVARLPSDLRTRIGGLLVDNTSPFTITFRADRRARLSQRPEGSPNWMYPHAMHDIISRHPVTGEEFLYVSQMHTSHVVGWDDEMSDALFAELERFAYYPDNIYSHQWKLHDFVVWDNIALQHRRDAIRAQGARTMRRAMANPYELGEMYAAAEAAEWKPALTYGAGGNAIYVDGTWKVT